MSGVNAAESQVRSLPRWLNRDLQRSQREHTREKLLQPVSDESTSASSRNLRQSKDLESRLDREKAALTSLREKLKSVSMQRNVVDGADNPRDIMDGILDQSSTSKDELRSEIRARQDQIASLTKEKLAKEREINKALKVALDNDPELKRARTELVDILSQVKTEVSNKVKDIFAGMISAAMRSSVEGYRSQTDRTLRLSHQLMSQAAKLPAEKRAALISKLEKTLQFLGKNEVANVHSDEFKTLEELLHGMKTEDFERAATVISERNQRPEIDRSSLGAFLRTGWQRVSYWLFRQRAMTRSFIGKIGEWVRHPNDRVAPYYFENNRGDMAVDVSIARLARVCIGVDSVGDTIGFDQATRKLNSDIDHAREDLKRRQEELADLRTQYLTKQAVEKLELNEELANMSEVPNRDFSDLFKDLEEREEHRQEAYRHLEALNEKIGQSGRATSESEHSQAEEGETVAEELNDA